MTLLALAFAAVLLLLVVRRIRRRTVAALLAVTVVLGFNTTLGIPAVAQDDCAEAPTPEIPGAGLAGSLDTSDGQGEASSSYADYGYAGMVWHTYNTNCGPLSTSLTSPTTTFDTWLGNQLFDIAKTLVAVTNALHYTLMNGSLLAGLTDQIRQAADAVFSNVYTQLVSLALLLLAIGLLRLAWQGAFATVSRRGLIALGALGVAASAPALVASYPVVDDLIVTTTTKIQAGTIDLDNDDQIIRDQFPTELHTAVVYESWLRGEFGTPDHPKVTQCGEIKQCGRQLLDAQAFTWNQVHHDEHTNPTFIGAKQRDYQQIATQLGSATDTFTGEAGSRTGAGFLALLQAIAYTIFPLLAKLGVLLAQVLLRIATLAAPFIGLAALIQPDALRKTGKAAATTALTVLVLAILAGIHTQLLHLIISPNTTLPLLIQIALALLSTVLFLAVGRPVRRIHNIMLALSAGKARGNIFQDGNQAGGQREEFRKTVYAVLAKAAGTVSRRSSKGRAEAVVSPPPAVEHILPRFDTTQIGAIKSDGGRLVNLVLCSNGAISGAQSTPETIRQGTVRMEDHPHYPEIVEYLSEKGFSLTPVEKENEPPHVVVRRVVDTAGHIIAIEREVWVQPGMRFLDLEHEIGHVDQITDPRRFPDGPPHSEVMMQLPDGRRRAARGPALVGRMTPWQDAIIEYHVRLLEFIRLAERGVDPELLREHASGVDHWRTRYWRVGLARGESKSQQVWAEQHFPDLAALQHHVQSLRATSKAQQVPSKGMPTAEGFRP